MGESVSEATIIKWLKQPGDRIEEDDAIIEIATDKVDSEVPAPVAGILKAQLFEEGAVVQVGQVLAEIETEAEAVESVESAEAVPFVPSPEASKAEDTVPVVPASIKEGSSSEGRFYSPLVRNIAVQEGISAEELDSISGSGSENRVTKQDILQYLEQRKEGQAPAKPQASQPVSSPAAAQQSAPSVPSAPSAPAVQSGSDEIIEMDRMRRLIADHMVNSVKTSPHVCSFVEADVTNVVNWRNKVKASFEKREGEKITFTPIFMEAVTRAIKDYPLINSSIDGYTIIKKRNINIGMATALPSGNLIVPVIQNADQLSLVGLSKAVNDLANRARNNKLRPDDTQGGTFTVTNVGAFGNITGTPIINQPQVAILAVGTITKKPAVIETEYGDVIAIRHKMVLSLSYDHRVVDGSLGGRFLKQVADYLEAWDPEREF